MENPINDKYSRGNFVGVSFTDIDPSEFSNTLIVGSCFYHEIISDTAPLRVNIFPAGIENLQFKMCNLDNIYLPADSELIGEGNDACTNKLVSVNSDGELIEWL